MTLTVILTVVYVCLGTALLLQSVVANPEEMAKKEAVFFRTRRDLYPTGDPDHNMSSILPDIDYCLFTRVNPDEFYKLEATADSLEASPFDNFAETKFIIHGRLEKLENSSLFFTMKNEILKAGRYNVIIVNWTKYSQGTRSEVTSRAPIVGMKIGWFIEFLKENEIITSESIHIIGHSIGAHVAGFAGKVSLHLGRITGLDAIGQDMQNLPRKQRLTYTDALFVDAIHTNGAASTDPGHGTLLPYAQLDSFPNGGSEQPGCGDSGKENDVNTGCSHHRSVSIFIASINDCAFWALNCDSYKDFEDGKCTRETSAIGAVGFHASPIPALKVMSKFYFNTMPESPYCIYDTI